MNFLLDILQRLGIQVPTFRINGFDRIDDRRVLDLGCDLRESMGRAGFIRTITIPREETIRSSAAHNGFDPDLAIAKRNAAIVAVNDFFEACSKM